MGVSALAYETKSNEETGVMSNDLAKRLRIQAGHSLIKLPEGHVYASHSDAADRIEELEKETESLASVIQELVNEDKDALIDGLRHSIARIQYTNLRRDMNAKNRTIEIDKLCKGAK